MKDSGLLFMAMGYLLGLRHGLDLDHLATIDAMTRIVSPNRYLSKFVGFLFSFGHGLVVIIISLVIGSGYQPAHIPEWLNGFGNGISIASLFAFGLLNLWNVFQSPNAQAVPTSLQNYVAKKLLGKNINGFFIVGIGMMFAVSFDTVSQIVLFSLSAKAMAGFLFSGLLGLVFMLGMMTTDGLNGWFVSMLIQRADTTSLMISRAAGFMIASFSLIIGIINCIRISHA